MKKRKHLNENSNSASSLHAMTGLSIIKVPLLIFPHSIDRAGTEHACLRQRQVILRISNTPSMRIWIAADVPYGFMGGADSAQCTADTSAVRRTYEVSVNSSIARRYNVLP